MRGQSRHQMTHKFPVIVAEQGDFRKYRVKRDEMMYFYGNTDENSAFRNRNTRKHADFTKSAAYSMRFEKIHNETHHFL